MSKRKEGRKRVSRDRIRENAKKGGGGGTDWFDLPEEVGRWTPEKAARYSIDVLPYEVKGKNHPDDVEPGCLWYKFPFAVHHGVGASNQHLVCPGSIGKPCPMCEERNRLYKEDADKNEDLLNDLRPQKFVAYNVVDPEDDQKVSLFIMSRGKFAAPLEDELKDPDNEKHLAFFDVNEDGRTLRVRFNEASFQNKKYLEATKIDFKKRDEMDEDEILDKVVCLEEALVVTPYDKIKSLFLQEEDPDEPEEEPDEPEEEPDEPEEEPDEPEEEEEEEKPKGKKCKACKGTGKSSKGGKCKPCKGTGRAEPEDEPEEKKEEEEKPKKKGEKEGKSKTPECPVEGGKFGQVDEYDECDDCPHWDACEEASN